jgi:flagellar hook-associated protein 1 FlgK
MSLSLALNNALSGLKVNQESISVLSQNIANVNTAGYSRQVLNQSAVSVGNVGEGVTIDSITRKVDAYLQRSVVTQTSANQSAQTLTGYYTNLQNLLGQPGASNSIDTYMTGFFNSVQQLAETPDTDSLKANAVQAGATLANTISALAGNVNTLRQDADGNISTAVASVNASLTHLNQINQQLEESTNLPQGQSNSSLLDARDKELSTLAGYMNISTTFDSTGAVTVVAGSGAVLVEQGTVHQLQYTKAGSSNTFSEDSAFAPLQVLTLNSTGAQIAPPQTLISGGTSSQVTSTITGGSIAAYQQIRDQQFPAILDQLDTLSAGLRDSVNTIQNQGSGFPPATSLTGDRALYPSDASTWTGEVRIAVLNSDGSPVVGNYADEPNGVQPLTLNLATLNSGNGAGTPSLQTIIDEINNHFGSPGNKAEVGGLNNVQLVSDNTTLPQGSPDQFNFDLDLNNITGSTVSTFVTGISVTDDTGTNITNVTQTAPSVSLQPANTYQTTSGSPSVTVNLTQSPTVAVGDTIYMNSPGVPVNGIPAANLTGFFTVTAVSGNTVTFNATANATASTPPAVNIPGIQMMEPYANVAPGDQVRAGGASNTDMQVDLSGNPLSNYYDITLNVSSVDANGVVTTAPVTYRVPNNVQNNLNTRYDATAVGAPGNLVLPATSQPSLKAIMVDKNGVELPKVNGEYVNEPGYLELVGGSNGATQYGVAIDEMNSSQQGNPNNVPATAGTDWGFSHYFGLNNFFTSNNLTATGDAVKGSAENLAVEQRLLSNANLISTGNLEQVSSDTTSGATPNYSYARYSGDNSVAQNLAGLNTKALGFAAAGGLPTTNESLLGYTSDMLGSISQQSSTAASNATNAQTLYDGFNSRAQAVSGVNLDEELANTVTYQNAYSATARVITIVNEMYSSLLQAFS